METNMNGLSIEFIIHPGETLREILEDREMLQEELAERTGFSAKHISEVINGKKRISAKLAKSLEYVFGISAAFWINLQGIYEKEIIEFEERNNISEEEIEIAREIKPILEYAISQKIIEEYDNDIESVLKAREICGVQDLTYITKLLSSRVAYRTVTSQNVNQNIIYVWQRICELIAMKQHIKNTYDEEILKRSLVDIKKLMFEKDVDIIIQKLKGIFEKCGIVFEMVKHFTGAPVQGFIKNKNDKIILCMTIRQSYADIFWFTLFHEIGHIINGDIERNRIEYYIENESKESEADNFAMNVLLNEKKYKEFVSNKNFTKQSIRNFSEEQKVQPFIVIGRLQRDKIIKYNMFSDLKIRYKWK